MKMVDGSTVRHGRVDCSYPESASESAECRGAVGGKNRRGDGNEEGGKRRIVQVEGERNDGG